jgi:tetratricopeptide (TPR) repeat protein
MHISVVTWISQTKTSIFLIFYFLALGKYLKYINSGFKIKYLIYAGLLMILSALSKPTAVTLAPILLLLDYYLSRKFDKRLIIEKIPFFAIAIFFGILTLLTHSQAEDSIFDVNQDYSLINNILVSNYSIVFYINKLFFPFNLCTIYPYPENTNFLPLRYYLSLPIIPIILFLIYKAGNFRKEMIFGILFFVIAISVLIRIIPSGFFRAANRYTYLSYTGLFLIIGQYIVYVIDNKFSYSRKIKGSLIALFCLYIVMLSVLTFQRIDVWQNSITLFDDIIRKKPKLVIAYNNRAIAKKDIGDYEGAIADFSKSIEIDPKYAPAFNNRGEIKRLLKDDKAALNDYNEAIRLNPKYVEAYNNRGIVLYNQGKLSEAMVDYNTAISLNSKNGATYNNRAIVKFIQKDTLGALEDWKKAKELGIAEANKPIELFNSAFTANNNPDKD